MSASISFIDKNYLPENFVAESSLKDEPLEFQASFNDDDDGDDSAGGGNDDIVLGLMSGFDDDQGEDQDQDGDDQDFSVVDVTGHSFATETDLALAA